MESDQGMNVIQTQARGVARAKYTKRRREGGGAARNTSGDEQHRARAMSLEQKRAQAKRAARGGAATGDAGAGR